ncbi:hypothetical protein Ocin01_00297 [Orchesella cincta]|uniref:Uncharacterized protein n=1 Tax=Orchesella cincta TaxID=48709 RepID=A0A1D2NMA6_ORCCI|nr:hypothetical protein Ocin01_00297 [Orchesella cincta]
MSFCCPCSRRSRALLVGILDLIVGSGGLSAVCFLLYIITNEMSKLQEDSPIEYNERMHILTGLYWSVMLSYVFPATVTLIIGIFTVFAVAQNNDCCAIASILLTIILVFACAGILLILYLIRIELPFLIPLSVVTILHVIFTFVLLSFRANDLKAQRTV